MSNEGLEFTYKWRYCFRKLFIDLFTQSENLNMKSFARSRIFINYLLLYYVMFICSANRRADGGLEPEVVGLCIPFIGTLLFVRWSFTDD